MLDAGVEAQHDFDAGDGADDPGGGPADDDIGHRRVAGPRRGGQHFMHRQFRAEQRREVLWIAARGDKYPFHDRQHGASDRRHAMPEKIRFVRI
jgi:hypothetical protein